MWEHVGTLSGTYGMSRWLEVQLLTCVANPTRLAV